MIRFSGIMYKYSPSVLRVVVGTVRVVDTVLASHSVAEGESCVRVLLAEGQYISSPPAIRVMLIALASHFMYALQQLGAGKKHGVSS